MATEGINMWAQALCAARTFQLIDVSEPRLEDLAPGEVIVRLSTGAICGSDLPFYRGDFSPATTTYGEPGRPMHEVVGTVVESTDPNFKKGQRVVGWAKGHRGFTEYFVGETDHLVIVDDHYDDLSAIVIQPLACIHYALDQVGDVKGKRVAVIGQGPIGVLFSHMLKARGAAEVIGVDTIDRTGFLDVFGIDTFVHDSSFNWARTMDRPRPDIVIEAVGHQAGTLNDAIEAVAMQGQIYAFGVPNDSYYAIHYHRMFRKDLMLRGGTTYHHADCLKAAQIYLNDFPELPKQYITDVFTTEQANEAYALAAVPRIGQMKVALQVPGA
jgi:threonine dehydrogenase-like Zn-dependent dehydrogenase